MIIMPWISVNIIFIMRIWAKRIFTAFSPIIPIWGHMEKLWTPIWFQGHTDGWPWNFSIISLSNWQSFDLNWALKISIKNALIGTSSPQGNSLRWNYWKSPLFTIIPDARALWRWSEFFTKSQMLDFNLILFLSMRALI